VPGLFNLTRAGLQQLTALQQLTDLVVDWVDNGWQASTVKRTEQRHRIELKATLEPADDHLGAGCGHPHGSTHPQQVRAQARVPSALQACCAAADDVGRKLLVTVTACECIACHCERGLQEGWSVVKCFASLLDCLCGTWPCGIMTTLPCICMHAAP